ncbi:MAG: helix-turn-helix transcriptional regulator [Chloroflexota bacterium]
MARDIPPEVPDKIAFIIRERWGDIKTFARESGITYATAKSVLIYSNRKIVNTLEALAKPIGVPIEVIAEAMTLTDIERRKAALGLLLSGRSVRQWSKEAGVSQSGLTYLVNNPDNFQVRNVKDVSNALGISIDALLDAYPSSDLMSA